ncbi:MAG: hypothetical protein WC663_02945 [Patescibacteria group bacterium]
MLIFLISFLSIDLIWLIEKRITIPISVYQESMLFPFRIIAFLILIGVFFLALNKQPLGIKLKILLLKLIDPRSIIFLAIIFLSICCFFLFFKADPIAEKAANVAYLLLVIGAIGLFIQYLINLRRERKNKLPKI